MALREVFGVDLRNDTHNECNKAGACYRSWTLRHLTNHHPALTLCEKDVFTSDIADTYVGVYSTILTEFNDWPWVFELHLH